MLIYPFCRQRWSIIEIGKILGTSIACETEIEVTDKQNELNLKCTRVRLHIIVLYSSQEDGAIIGYLWNAGNVCDLSYKAYTMVIVEFIKLKFE